MQLNIHPKTRDEEWVDRNGMNVPVVRIEESIPQRHPSLTLRSPSRSQIPLHEG